MHSRQIAPGVTWVNFGSYVPLGSQNLYPIVVYSVTNSDPILVTFGQGCNFLRYPNLVSFSLCIHLILNEEHFTFHIQYKHSGTFANRI